jgi:hypothetical protein
MSDFDGAKFVRGYELIQALPIASGTVVDVGDLVKISGGNVEPMGATTDNLVFVGVAKEAHAATDGAGQISVALRNVNAIYRMTLDAAATIAVGANLQAYTSDPEKKLTPSDTDPIATCVKGGTSVTEVDVVFSLPGTTTGIDLVGDAS